MSVRPGTTRDGEGDPGCRVVVSYWDKDYPNTPFDPVGAGVGPSGEWPSAVEDFDHLSLYPTSQQHCCAG